MDTIAATADTTATATWNDPPPLPEQNLFRSDVALEQAVQREGGGWAAAPIAAFGALTGRTATLALGTAANANVPTLRPAESDESTGEIEFDPAWHELMRIAIEHGLHALPWLDARPGAHVARAALVHIAAQNDYGHLCPVGMTFAGIPVLRMQPELAAVWEPRLTSLAYDPSVQPATRKRGALLGMGMTERQGGSDVRMNTSVARPVQRAGPGMTYLLTGHKWFCSAPMCDVFLVLARAERGLSCFLLPRLLDDGTPNRFFIRRLKDKLGNRSNASAEVEFDNSVGWLIGDEGRGVRTIIEMVNLTRLDCAVSSAAMMRTAVRHALHHAHHRRAFGRLLIDQPLMRNVLADLALEVEAATVLALRIAGASDRQLSSETERSFLRLALPVTKYWIAKRATSAAGEALECLGGSGYVEDSPLPRLYRDLPLNSIWEGTGNVVCLDALRAIEKEPQSLETVLDEIEKGAAGEPRLRGVAERLREDAARALSPPSGEAEARRLAERLAVALQASLLTRHAPPPVADAFCGSRLATRPPACFGTLPPGTAFDEVVQRFAHAG